MSEELPDDEITQITLHPYGTSTFGAGEELPEPTEEEQRKIDADRYYSPESTRSK